MPLRTAISLVFRNGPGLGDTKQTEEPGRMPNILEMRKEGQASLSLVHLLNIADNCHFCLSHFQILYPQHREAAVVLLVCHPAGLPQHAMRRRRTLQPAGLVERISL